MSIQDLPDELVAQGILSLLEHTDLSRVSLVSKRLASLTPCCKLWKALFIARWQTVRPVHEDAARLAGSWRALYRAKFQTDAISDGWTRPCEFELNAVLQGLAQRATAATDAATASKVEKKADKEASAGKAPPPPASPTCVLSPVASLSSSPSTSLPASPSLSGASSGFLNNGVGPSSPTRSPVGGEGVRGAAPREAHLVYLLDGSGSVSEEDFSEMKQFVVRSAPVLTAALGAHSKIGVVQFSTEPRVEVPLRALDDEPEGLRTALDAIVRQNGGTNIASAIARAGAMMNQEDQTTALLAAGLPLPPTGGGGGGDAGVAPGDVPALDAVMWPTHDTDTHMTHVGPEASSRSACGPPAPPVRLVLLLTDGRIDSYQAREARATASRLSDELCGCLLAAFGVGRGVDRTELLHIIDTPQGDASSRYLDLYTRDDAPW